MVYGTLIDPGLIPPVIPSPEGEQHPGSPQTCVSLLFLVPLVPADRDMAAWASPPTQRAPMGSQCCSCSEESANTTRYQELVVFTRLVLRRTDFNYQRRKESLKICMQAQGWGCLRRKQNLEGSIWRTSKSQADQAVKHGLSPADFDSSLQTRPVKKVGPSWWTDWDKKSCPANCTLPEKSQVSVWQRPYLILGRRSESDKLDSEARSYLQWQQKNKLSTIILEATGLLSQASSPR